MVSLVDIGVLRRKITLRGNEIEFKGLPAKFLVDLLAQSTELRMILAERSISGDLITTLISDFPNMVAEMIAAANGKPGDPDTIAFVLLELSPGEWLEILGPVFEMTFPKGVKSFVDALLRAAQSSGLDVPGWDQGTKSPAPSPAASQPVTTQTQPGTTLPANSEPGPSLSKETASSNSAA
jgi:hypothetical protein